jgi:hypothetical protein
MLGSAAVAIWCDVSPGMREEFDDWHAHEHMPERLSIPGFLRGSRWVSDEGGYFMLYEVRDEAVLTGAPYLERLNNPTPWSRQMMPHHRDMVRGLCRVEESHGRALGHALATVRFASGQIAQRLAQMASRKGLVAAHLLRNVAHASAQTVEQKLRGGDGAPDRVALVIGYSFEAVGAARQELVLPGAVAATYRLAYALTS